MYTQEPPIYIPMKLAVSCHRSAHDKVFTKSRILSDAVPLGFCCGGFSSTAGYDPATKLNFRRAACPPWRVLFQRVPLVSEWLKKVSQLSPAEPFGSDSGVIGLTAACFSPQPMRHRIGYRPFVGLEGLDPRDTCFIPQRIFTVNIWCVLFFVFDAKEYFRIKVDHESEEIRRVCFI
jgi:hypothetical protein